MNPERVKRKLSAILSADVEGYSRLMGDDEVATVHTLEAYRKVFADVIEQHRGRVVDSPGDNLLAEFGSVVDAVQCAVEVQQILKAKNAELPENRRMRFRIGINLGDVIQEEDRIYGDGVNIAARIEGLAEAGGICVSGSAYEQIENKLALEYQYFGEHAVKNIAKPIKVYKVPMEPGVSKKKSGSKGWKKLAIAAAAVLILVGGALAVWQFYFRPPPVEVVKESEMAFPLPNKPSIAVLPFVNVSGDPGQEYIADGITEQIITTLARNPYLFVIASNSTFTYKGKPVKVQQVSRELGVRYVVEGSVQKSGDRVRITVQLIDATTGEHLWAKTYDRNLKDIFALQDEITIRILGAIGEKLLGGGPSQIKGTDNVEAYLKWLKAITLNARNQATHRLARQMFEEVVSLDPAFAGGYIGLGWSIIAAVQNGWSNSPKRDLKRAFNLAQKTIGLDQSLATPHLLLGWIYLTTGKNEKAIAEAQRAVALVPNDLFAIGSLGNFLAWADRPEEAISVLTRAYRLCPFNAEWMPVFMGNAYYVAGRYEEALSYFKKLQGMNPDNLWAYMTPASIYGQLGRDKEAHVAAKDILRIDPSFSVKHWEKWPGCKNRDKWNQWLDGIRKAGLPE